MLMYSKKPSVHTLLQGKTALMNAAKANQKNIVEYPLWEAKADVCLPNSDVSNAVHADLSEELCCSSSKSAHVYAIFVTE